MKKSFLLRRRVRNLAVVVLVFLGMLWAVRYNELCLENVNFLTGWILFGILVILLAYNWRKKLPIIPLGSSAAWLQFHIYMGWLCGAVFFLHIHFRMPNGILETLLASVFFLVFCSGILGLVLSRIIPAILARRGEHVIFERIPSLLTRVRRQAENLVLTAVQETQSSTIADFYNRELVDFFSKPTNFWAHIVNSDRFIHRVDKNMRVMQPYLNERERDFFERLKTLVHQKNHLDAHHSGGIMLKYWLFVHIPMSYSLMVLAAVHALIVHAFVGGL